MDPWRSGPVVYLRGALAEEPEKQAAAKYFHVVGHRAAIPSGSLVIPRYSALPFLQELVDDMADQGCTLINTKAEHDYVANLRNWYYDLADLTPRTWFALDQMPVEGPFVLKGATNSMKFYWNTHMFAKDRYAAMEVAANLFKDANVGVQPIYGREYVPLRKLADGLNGLPISEEYRFFYLDGQLVDAGFYWSSHVDDIEGEFDPMVEVPKDFLAKVVERVGDKIRFWVVDVARKADGGWMVVELNDGQQSGLGCIDPDRFYRRLAATLSRSTKAQRGLHHDTQGKLTSPKE
jgi:hypothetical protein